jgi:hypothetical protein
MGLYDEVATASPAAVQQTRPTKGRFIKEGYFDWENKAHATQDPNNKAIREAVGVILPPYASYLSERVAAAKQGIPFNFPFSLAVGNHVMGGRQDKDKVYHHCQRDLIRSNKVGAGYPMLPADVVALGDSCPICDTCWDSVWPRVKEQEHNKASPEYKSYKDAHRQLCPQQKSVFNFLPQGSDTPVLLEASKTLAEYITNLHYDPKQPDLLWPYAIGTFACCWVQIRRHDQPDTTTYSVFPVYHNVPHVRNTQGAFDEATYLKIIAKMKDLREVSRSYLPTPEETAKALAKRDKILVFQGLAVAQAVGQQVAQATAGVAGGIAAQPPPIAPAPPMFPVPGAVTPPAAGAVISTPTATLPPTPTISASGPPPIGAAPAPAPAALPATPPPPAMPPVPTPTKEAENAFDVLQGLLGGNK